MQNRESKEKLFEEKARNILNYLRSQIRYDQKVLPRPFFVEITGSPDAGKSTTTEELDNSLRKEGLRVWCPQEGAEVIRHIDRKTPLYNLRTGLYALNILIDESASHRYDIVIFNRCLFDMYCWMEEWFSEGQLTEKEKVTYQNLALSRFWVDNIDIAVFMVCDPAISMKRALRIAPIKKEGGTTNYKKVASLVERYKNTYKTLSEKYPQLHLIDTTKLEEQEMVDAVTTKILDALEAKTKNGSSR